MEYVAIGILFLLVLGAGITMFVMVNAKGQQAEAAADDTKRTGAPFEGQDSTPLGDTSQHAGEQDQQGQTVSRHDAEKGGAGPSQVAEEPSGGRFKRDPIGGEAEAGSAIDVGPAPRPDR